ncbi:MAG: hypothetical protein HYS14_03500 [Candidatus Rokubacteria bacterium]|nr:hypothetical protein [Candidatus Rokubacteria bacterium]MBI3457779.1 hypothetical protein [Candidatus Rokubacteria bacterium]
MSRKRVLGMAALAGMVLTAGILMMLGGDAGAQGLPPGVHLEVVAEYPSSEPGIEKIVVKKFTLDPGAKLENFTPDVDNL